MDCKALLALIPDECNRRPRKRKRSSSRQGSSALRAGGSHALRAGDGAVLDSAVDILALIPRKRDRIYVDRNPKVRLKIRSKGKLSRQSMQQVVRTKRKECMEKMDAGSHPAGRLLQDQLPRFRAVCSRA